jgi:hypothetical protein
LWRWNQKLATRVRRDLFRTYTALLTDVGIAHEYQHTHRRWFWRPSHWWDDSQFDLLQAESWRSWRKIEESSFDIRGSSQGCFAAIACLWIKVTPCPAGKRRNRRLRKKAYDTDLFVMWRAFPRIRAFHGGW